MCSTTLYVFGRDTIEEFMNSSYLAVSVQTSLLSFYLYTLYFVFDKRRLY